MDLKRFITIVDLQARAELKAEASKLSLSYLWWVLEPLLFVAVFYVVFSFLLDRGTENFVFFLMCGKVPFLWFSKTVTQASSSILANKGLIASTQIDKVIFPYIAIQEVVYKQWVVFLVLFVMALFLGTTITTHWLWLIPLMFVTYLMIVAISLIGAAITTFMQDFRIIISMGMLFLMFASGIFWDINDIQDAYWRDMMLMINPLAFLIDAYRKILMYNEPLNLYHLSYIGAASVAAITGLHIFFKRANTKLTQYVLQS